MFQDCSKIYMGIALKHAWNIAGKYALEPHGTVPRFLGTLGTVPRPDDECLLQRVSMGGRNIDGIVQVDSLWDGRVRVRSNSTHYGNITSSTRRSVIVQLSTNLQSSPIYE